MTPAQLDLVSATGDWSLSLKGSYFNYSHTYGAPTISETWDESSSGPVGSTEVDVKFEALVGAHDVFEIGSSSVYGVPFRTAGGGAGVYARLWVESHGSYGSSVDIDLASSANLDASYRYRVNGASDPPGADYLVTFDSQRDFGDYVENASLTSELSVTFNSNTIALATGTLHQLRMRGGDEFTVDYHGHASGSSVSFFQATATSQALMSVGLDSAGGVTGVTAAYDENGPADGFGRYLTGVKLQDAAFFTATTQGSGVKSVRLEIDGQPTVTKAVNANGVATFPFDPGTLAAGDYALTATALDATGNRVGDPYTNTVKAIDRLGLTLQADVPGTGLADASRLRLVDGVQPAPSLQFTAAAAGVPMPDVYLPRLTVWFSDHATNTPAFFGPTSWQNGTATFAVPAASFQDTVSDLSTFDWDAFLGPTNAFKEDASPRKLGIDDSAHVFVVDRPDWLRTAAASYASDGAIGAALGDGTLGYAFRLQEAELNVSLPGPNGPLTDLFGDLDSSLTSGLEVFLFARLTGDRADDAKFGVGGWNVEVKLLGDLVFDQTLSPKQANLDVSGTLADPRTLTGVGSVTVATLQPVNLLPLLQAAGNDTTINWEFGTGEKKKWQITGHYGPVSATLSLAGGLSAALTELGAEGSLAFFLNDTGAFTLDRNNSWAQLNVAAASHLEFTVTGTLGVNILGASVNFVEANLKGELDVAFAAKFRVTLDKPTDLDKKNSYAGLRLTAQFFYAVGLLPDGKPDFRPFTDPILFGPFDLFGLKLPPGGGWGK